jgi:hypothetical protein
LFLIDTGVKQQKRLVELRQFEVDLLVSHIALAKSDQSLYAGLTSSNVSMISEIASIPLTRIQNFAVSAKVGPLANWSPLFRRAFDVNELIEEANVRKTDVRIHEGVPVEILNLQYAQQKLLFTYCELAGTSPALASVVLGIRRSEATAFAELNSSNLLHVDSTQLLWSLPFRRPGDMTKFFVCLQNPETASFAFDLLRGY